jgi:hypothetical protein
MPEAPGRTNRPGQPRPDFAEKANDWPKDKKPAESSGHRGASGPN